MRVFGALIFLLVLYGCGCSTSQVDTTRSASWPDPSSDWRENAPSLDPVTNVVIEPNWSPVPPPSRWELGETFPEKQKVLTIRPNQ